MNFDDNFWDMGSFNNYVDMILPFFDRLLTFTLTFFALNVDQNWHFLTTYPPHFVHVVFERPLFTFGPNINFAWCITLKLNFNRNSYKKCKKLMNSKLPSQFKFQIMFQIKIAHIGTYIKCHNMTFSSLLLQLVPLKA